MVTLGGTGSGTFADKNVGTAKTVSVTGFTISRRRRRQLHAHAAGPTADITAQALTVSASPPSNKVYDGTTAATAAAPRS